MPRLRASATTPAQASDAEADAIECVPCDATDCADVTGVSHPIEATEVDIRSSWIRSSSTGSGGPPTATVVSMRTSYGGPPPPNYGAPPSPGVQVAEFVRRMSTGGARVLSRNSFADVNNAAPAVMPGMNYDGEQYKTNPFKIYLWMVIPIMMLVTYYNEKDSWGEVDDPTVDCDDRYPKWMLVMGVFGIVFPIFLYGLLTLCVVPMTRHAATLKTAGEHQEAETMQKRATMLLQLLAVLLCVGVGWFIYGFCLVLQSNMACGMTMYLITTILFCLFAAFIVCGCLTTICVFGGVNAGVL